MVWELAREWAGPKGHFQISSPDLRDEIYTKEKWEGRSGKVFRLTGSSKLCLDRFSSRTKIPDEFIENIIQKILSWKRS